MKKKIFFLFILFCMNTILLVSQNNEAQNDIIKKELKPLLNSEFTKIITGNSFTNFGRYIGVSTTNQSLNLSGATVKDLEIWSYKISAGANNGFATLFNGLELNTNVGAEFTYNKIVNIFTKKIRIGTKNRIITTNLIARNSKINNWERVEKEKLYTQYKSDSINIANKKELIDATYKINKLKNKINTLNIRNPKNKLTKDSVNYAIQRAVFDHNSIRKKIAILSNSTYTDTALRELKTNLDEEYDKISELKLEKSEVRVLDLTWFSAGYGLNNRSFNLFDESKPIEEQINNDSYLSHQFNIGLSRYRKDKITNTNFYWSLGLNLKLTNNLSELTTKEIIDTEVISQNPLREIQSKKEVFVGNYEKGIKKVNVFFDYYKFFGYNDVVAFHLNPMISMGSEIQSTTSILTGILLPIKDSPKSSFVNIEIFYKFNDIFNETNNTQNIFQRNTFGINASFPLKFNAKN